MTVLTATADAWIEDDKPTLSNNSTSQLQVRGKTPTSYEAWTILTFDIPQGVSVNAASLTINAVTAVAGAWTVSLASPVANPTWNTRPSLGALLSTPNGIVAGANTVPLDASQIPTGTTVSLVLTKTGGGVFKFTSTEGGFGAHIDADIKTERTGVQVWPRPDLVELPPSGASSFVFVDPVAGTDTGTGLQDSPVRTIEQGFALVSGSSPTEIRVQGNATYNPQAGLALPSSNTPVWLRMMGATRPVIDFAGRADTGVRASLRPLNMAGMEITGANFQGGLMGKGSTWEQNVFRDCQADATSPASGLDLEGVKCSASDSVFQDNLMFRCGQYWGEGRGILLNAAQRVTVQDNQFWWGRKEGTRDATNPGVDNTYLRNVWAMWWIGMNAESICGTRFENNLVAWCTYGMCSKHHYKDPTLWPNVPPLQPASADPGLTHWMKFHHNTVIDSMNAAFWWPGPAPFGDFVSVQHNLFCGSNVSYVNMIMDSPTIRGNNVIVDNNGYVTSGIPNVPPLMFKQYSGNGTYDSPSLAMMRQLTGFELNGRELPLSEAGFVDYPNGDYRASGSRPVSSDGQPLGATGIPALDVVYNNHRPESATADFRPDLAPKMIDGDTTTLWFAGTGHDTATATFTLPDDTPPFNVLRYCPWAASAVQSVKSFDLQFAGADGVFSTHSTVRFHDSEGANYHINLGGPVTAKFVRFLNATNWAAATADPPNGLQMGDVSVGTTSLAGSPKTQVTG